jgi:predicted Zn-dependent protease
VHITRGALALIKSESELAGVLGHEICARRAEAHGERHPQGKRSVGNQRDASPIAAQFLDALANRA